MTGTWVWLTVLGALSLCCGISQAFGADDPFALEAANRMGLLERCQELGFATQDDIQNAAKVLKNRPTSPPTVQVQAAENEGKRGVVLAAGQHMPLAQLAAQAHKSVQQMCNAVAESASAAAGLID